MCLGHGSRFCQTVDEATLTWMWGQYTTAGGQQGGSQNELHFQDATELENRKAHNTGEDQWHAKNMLPVSAGNQGKTS